MSFTSSLDGMCGAVQALIRNAALCSTHKDARVDNNSEIDDIIRSNSLLYKNMEDMYVIHYGQSCNSVRGLPNVHI